MGQVVVPVAADWEKRSDCDWNVALEWGDTVEIPEADHVQGHEWFGLAEPTASALRRCSARRVKLTIKNDTFELILRPAKVQTAPTPGGRDAVFLTNEVFLNAGTAIPPIPGPSAEAAKPIELDTCTLKNVLTGSNRLRASSDLSRVQVTRTTTDQTWTFDVERDRRAAEFWLIDGDSIVVPERGSTP